MGPIKFNVTFLMDPPNCISTRTTFAPKKNLQFFTCFPMKLISFIVLEAEAIGMKNLKSKDL